MSQTEKNELVRCCYCGGDQFIDVHAQQSSWWARLTGSGQTEGRLYMRCLLCGAWWRFGPKEVKVVGYANTVNQFVLRDGLTAA